MNYLKLSLTMFALLNLFSCRSQSKIIDENKNAESYKVPHESCIKTIYKSNLILLCYLKQSEATYSYTFDEVLWSKKSIKLKRGEAILTGTDQLTPGKCILFFETLEPSKSYEVWTFEGEDNFAFHDFTYKKLTEMVSQKKKN